jgi:hypothetical protein
MGNYPSPGTFLKIYFKHETIDEVQNVNYDIHRNLSEKNVKCLLRFNTNVKGSSGRRKHAYRCGIYE